MDNIDRNPVSLHKAQDFPGGLFCQYIAIGTAGRSWNSGDMIAVLQGSQLSETDIEDFAMADKADEIPVEIESLNVFQDSSEILLKKNVILKHDSTFDILRQHFFVN